MNIDPKQSFPTVSIIIPVYNGERSIGACLESLLAQRYPQDAFEIIVVENGSTDATSDIVARYPVRLLHSAKRGPAAARNLGAANSQADILAFTDADCTADPHWLAELVTLYRDAAIGGVGGTILAPQDSPQNFVERFSHDFPPLVNFITGEHEFLPHLYTPNASYRRHLFEQVDGFNEQLLTTEDVDLAWRLQLQTGIRIEYCADAIIYHHHRSTRQGLARQYRHYGFGEILLDTMYRAYPNYPRRLGYQLGRLVQQSLALPRYLVSIVLNQARFRLGLVSPYQAMLPRLWMLVESQNILGKLEGLYQTRGMTTAQPALNLNTDRQIIRLFGNQTGG
ncbi:MAG: glycosyltransferase [Anaerolineaceae bacterium]|nr:glycosyltransferase [Anaerolineaceae bacterium]